MRELVGTWRLVEWVYLLEGDPPRHPFGAGATDDGTNTSWLTHTESGRMWATLMRAARAPLGTRTLAGAPEAARAEAAAGYVAYAGRWRVEADEVVHDVEVSLLPDWIGQAPRRHLVLADDPLTLTTPPEMTSSGRRGHNRLVWARIEEE